METAGQEEKRSTRMTWRREQEADNKNVSFSKKNSGEKRF
jgi:hypothetical protein